LLELVDNNPGIHADARDDGRRTALMWAAHHGHEEILKLLLTRSDVKRNKWCTRGDTALSCAARQGQTSLVELLLEPGKEKEQCLKGNNFWERAHIQAVLEGHSDVARVLYRWDTESIHEETMFGSWPVHFAVQRRPVSVVKLLVEEYNVDADIEDPKGYSPFTVAVDWGNEEVVRYFLEERRAQLES
ncbi:ankyrin, partial [Melanomma pulvis-pyrius CBS 109.77]